LEITEFVNHSSPKLIVRIDGIRGVGSYQLTSIIDSINSACFSQEIDTLESILEGEGMTEFREVMRDHGFVRNRMNACRRSSQLMITDARNGSIILEGVLVAGFTWMVLNTVGETFKEAWKETDTHKNLKDLFLSGQNRDAKKIVNKIEHVFNRMPFAKVGIAHYKVNVIEENSEKIIQIEIKVIDELERLVNSNPPREIVELLEKINMRNKI
jgi:hypothetical protein